MWFNMQACTQGVLVGHISTSTYHYVFLEVPGRLLAITTIKNLKICFSAWFLFVSILTYMEYIATGCLQYMTRSFLLSVMSQYLAIREWSV